MKIAYIRHPFRAASLAMIDQANMILEELAQQGFTATLRQLYYQFVSRDLIPNNMRSYKRLQAVINDARLAGLIDWDYLEDRTRGLMSWRSYRDPAAAIEEVARHFAIDRWKDQPYRVEVWIEKDALVGIIENVCYEMRVPYLSCRGYTSQSEMWEAAQRLLRRQRAGQTPLILHLGDHDPSGKDMTDDIMRRMDLFFRGHGGTPPEVRRLALTYDQVEEYQPPPNPAKMSDTRAQAYVEEFGYESWELDALDPRVMADLIRDAVLSVRDESLWDAAVEQEEEWREHLQEVSGRWEEIEEFLNE